MLMNAHLESMIAMIARVLSVKILRVALNAFVGKALLEMEDLATFLVRKKKFQKIITSRTIEFYHNIGRRKFM